MIKQWLAEIANPEKEYRCTPFWSWNDKLEEAELIRQAKEMKKAGIGGYIMHARGGLQTEYMSEEWMSCIRACIEEAERADMCAWFYDEKGWPSGCGGGALTEANKEYYLRWLAIAECNAPFVLQEGAEQIIGYCSVDAEGNYIDWGAEYPTDHRGLTVYCVEQFATKYYADVLNRDCVKAFIESSYERYYRVFDTEFGKAACGFFTDEPQFSRTVPYSETLSSAYCAQYGEDPNRHFGKLFLSCNDAASFRYHYYKLANRLFTENYVKQIYDWCETHHCRLTGHAMLEDSLLTQMHGTAGVMPMYEYMQQPGIDWLARRVSNPIIPMQAGSVAAQLGRPLVLSEMFALSGWSVSFRELKWIAEWQFVHGVNKICQHLEPYSIRGARKRDYPPAVYMQQPWWGEYEDFVTYFSRLGKLLAEGRQEPEVLIIHPMHSAWMCYDGNDNCKAVSEYDDGFAETIEKLASKQVLYHFGDETVLEKHGSVRNGRLVVGEMAYRAVVLPPMLTIEKSTLELLRQAIEVGIPVVSFGGLPQYLEDERSDALRKVMDRVRLVTEMRELDLLLEEYDLNQLRVCDTTGDCVKEIAFTKRCFPEHTVYYLVNQSKKALSCRVKIKENRLIRLLHLETMTLTEAETVQEADGVTVSLDFHPMQSYLLLASNEMLPTVKKAVPTRLLPLGRKWTISEMSDNALTLDAAEYRLANGSWQKKTELNALMEELIDARYDGELSLRFSFQLREAASYIKEIKLVCERPDLFAITINGKPMTEQAIGTYLDHSQHLFPIGSYLKSGQNEIIMQTVFHQTAEFYRAYFNKADVMEAEKNMLTYETELESIYLIGPFAVYSDSPMTESANDGLYSEGPFYPAPLPQTVEQGSITEQGFCFFTGRISLTQSVTWDGQPCALEIKPPYAALMKLFVNGRLVSKLMWDYEDVDITQYLTKGLNQITLELFSGNRNLLGPFHLNDGECYWVEPDTFKKSKVGARYTEGYTFVKFGLSE